MTPKDNKIYLSESISDFDEKKFEPYGTDQNKKRIQDDIEKCHYGIFMFVVRNDFLFILMACLCMCVSSVGIPLQTIIYGKVFGKLSDFYKNEYSELDVFMSDVRLLCGLIMLIGFVKMVVTWVGIIAWMKFGEKQSTRARTRTLNLMLSKNIAWFESNENLMGEISQTNRCIEELRCGTSEVVGLLVQTIASIIALFVTAMVLSWSLTLVIMASAPLMGLFGWLFGRLTYEAADLENELTAQASKILDWSLVCGAEIRIFNGKYYEMAKFNKLVELSASAYYKLANAIACNTGMLKCLTLLMFVQGFWFGNYMISIGKLKINDVFTCFSSCLMLGSEISEISILLATLNKAQAASFKIAKAIESNESLNDSGIYPPLCEGVIELENISFKYLSRPEKVLKDVSISFKSKEMNFIIGPSGSGKSTISQLLLKFYQPQSGIIRIDGLNISNLSTKWLTDNITLVQQDPVIFNESIRNNIGMATVNKFVSLSDIPDLLIEDAATFALLGSVIEDSRDGINTVVSLTSLSGGQLQRIAIARARISDTPILILDEALCALDIKHKQLILKNIKDWRKGKTTIIITHEFDQISDDDYVILMEGGNVKNKGYMFELTHEDLILEDRSGLNNKSHVNCRCSSRLYKAGTTKHDSMTYHYLKNPAVLKDLEKCSELSYTTDRRPSELLSVLSILQYCKKTIDNKTLIIFGIILSVIGGATSPIFSYCFSKILVTMVNASIGMNIKRELIMWSCIVVGISVGSGIILYLSLFTMSYASERWIVNLRKLVFKKLNEQEVSYFDSETTQASELTALLMNDARDLRSLVSEFVIIATNLIAMLSIGVIWSVITGWKLALVGVSFVPLILIITHAYSFVLELSENNYKTKVSILENYNHEIVSGIKLIKTLNLNKFFFKEFVLKLNEVNKVGSLRAVCTGFGISLSDLCTSLATGTILYYGMELAGKREYSQSQLIQVITVLSFSMTNAASLLTELPDIARGQRAGTYIINLLKLKPSGVENDGSIKPYKLCDDRVIRFQNVDFQYPNTRNPTQLVLSKLSFYVNKDEVVAITGESGSGKSTIGALLSRLYRVTDRSIFVTNYDINKLDIDWLRDTISVVTQVPKFFEGTIYDNLVYGMERSKILSVRIDHCLKLANIYPFIISLPEGIHTRLGEGQHSLISGGQLQRLSVARALIRKPKILIMDECTSNLDPHNTNLIIDLVKNNLSTQNITIILITHNLEMMKIANRVINIKQGKVLEG
ncbi:uncharacterized protein AC631_01359 [Debaryomyces fabryi]|uniref:Alpha-factor-transporting ATPase n=1 Tax=Debaryomyces fabryi TaxID=58627 RepID=A0A0V1Q3W7_9ASCO|nr:uncharacterized protein AC631_01359 [Debaryomyces fabryi]KSA02879.1 hypothetical protein AC631_01359 [Debaryomyces fabryi]CUM45047.1 unnamed protein product [Debaryomyces fabryi]